MLKTTKIELELLSDIDMYNFIMKCISGGLVYLKNDYDCDKESNYIVYLDVDNLYGNAMSQVIPYTNFKWVKQTEEGNFKNVDLNTCGDDHSIGYILEVHLEYTEN